MNLDDAINGRRSVRSYTETPVPFATVEELISLAVQAPSACGRRGWRFILVEDKELLKKLTERGGASFIRYAPQALILCYLSYSDNEEWADREQSAAAAAAYFQLAAHERGIGSCWVCHLPLRREIKRLFGIPSEYMPICCITFGYYTEKDRLRDKEIRENSAESFICMNRWNFNGRSGSSIRRLRRTIFVRRVFKKMYYLLPFRKNFRIIAERFEKKFPY